MKHRKQQINFVILNSKGKLIFSEISCEDYLFDFRFGDNCRHYYFTWDEVFALQNWKSPFNKFGKN